MNSMQLHFETLETPTGRIVIVTDDAEMLRAVDWDEHNARMHRLLRRHYGTYSFLERSKGETTEACRSIQAYFGGDLDACDKLSVRTNGTEFQKSVWLALRSIPVGQTTSYGKLARQIGRPSAARAVGLANGSNPIAIVVPCHRVIGADSSLTGFGGGLQRKEWLLTHEGARDHSTIQTHS